MWSLLSRYDLTARAGLRVAATVAPAGGTISSSSQRGSPSGKPIGELVAISDLEMALVRDAVWSAVQEF